MLGLATSFNLALTCRLIAGIFGANSTIVKGRLGEIQNSLNRAYGFTVYGVMHSLPYMIGNFLGAIFMRISKIVSIDSAIIQQGFPFLPLCLVSSFFATISLIIVYYFLIEPPKIQEFVVLNQEDEDELIHDTQESIELNDSIPDIQVPLQPKATEQVETIFNRKTTTSIFLYCIIACVNIMYMTLLPLYFAAPIEKGGLGYTPSSTSFYFILLSASKLAVNLSPIYKLIAKYGSNYCYTILITLYIPTISLIPIIGSLLSSPPLLLISFTIVMILLGVCESGTYMCVNIMISESVSRNRLGTVHGISSSASAIVRTLFPSISGVLFDLFSFKGGVFGVVVGVSFLGAVVSVL